MKHYFTYKKSKYMTKRLDYGYTIRGFYDEELRDWDVVWIYDEYGEEIDNNHHEFNSVIEDFVDCRDIYWVEFEDDFDVADFESRAA